jgi:ribosome biogenesis GTPase / thiamine phosphate phosphatase
LRHGRVIASHGRQFRVAADGDVITCVTRGRKADIACGDHVAFSATHDNAGVIEKVEPRANLLYRSDEFRSKLIAANVDLAVVVVAAVPYFREELLIRCLAACETADIAALIVLNKADLPDTAALAAHLESYAALGYDLITVSAHGDLAALEARLRDRVSVLVGASGVGKSTLLNRLAPHARAATGEISQALDAGKHTTTQARMYTLPGGGELIDSPGMQEFGLSHLDASKLMRAFPEIHTRAGQCRFHNCRHLKEPGCAVLEAARDGAINPFRLRVYHSLLGQLSS